MKYTTLLLISIFVLTLAGCDTVENVFTDEVINPDDLLTQEEVLMQNFNLRTPVYDIAVSIDSLVGLPQEEILILIDQEIAGFFDCQFFEGTDLGLDDFILDNQMLVTPLSDLRLYVVPNNFECDVQDNSICAGIYFGGSDSMAVAEQGFGRCGDLPLLKHEVGHRYGMLSDHSNQDEFAACSDPEDCGLLDFLDDLGIGG